METAGEIAGEQQKVKSLASELDNLKSEIGELQDQIEKKNATITRLENNVKLLKSEIGK